MFQIKHKEFFDLYENDKYQNFIVLYHNILLYDKSIFLQMKANKNMLYEEEFMFIQ